MIRTAVVTGVSGGIGSATARAFHTEGWQVVGLDRDTPAEGVPLAEFHACNLEDARAVVACLAELAHGLSEVHALVNNAAIGLDKGLADITVEAWDQVMAVNGRSALLAIQGLLAPLEAARGAVVNVASVHAVATSRNVAGYAASKGALLAFTRAAALDLAELGIRVNAVLPGAVDTPMLRAGLSRRVPPEEAQGELADLARRTPLGRVGQPGEIAEAIVFLADERRSSFVTGQALVVDGGASARLSTE